MSAKNEALERFLSKVCREIPVPHYAARVKRELRDHVTRSALAIQAEQRVGAQEAMRRAIAQMGDPTALGRAINKCAQPARRMLVLVACGVLWIGIAWCAVAIIGTVKSWFG